MWVCRDIMLLFFFGEKEDFSILSSSHGPKDKDCTGLICN